MSFTEVIILDLYTCKVYHLYLIYNCFFWAHHSFAPAQPPGGVFRNAHSLGAPPVAIAPGAPSHGENFGRWRRWLEASSWIEKKAASAVWAEKKSVMAGGGEFVRLVGFGWWFWKNVGPDIEWDWNSALKGYFFCIQLYICISKFRNVCWMVIFVGWKGYYNPRFFTRRRSPLLSRLESRVYILLKLN